MHRSRRARSTGRAIRGSSPRTSSSPVSPIAVATALGLGLGRRAGTPSAAGADGGISRTASTRAPTTDARAIQARGRTALNARRIRLTLSCTDSPRSSRSSHSGSSPRSIRPLRPASGSGSGGTGGAVSTRAGGASSDGPSGRSCTASGAPSSNNACSTRSSQSGAASGTPTGMGSRSSTARATRAKSSRSRMTPSSCSSRAGGIRGSIRRADPKHESTGAPTPSNATASSRSPPCTTPHSWRRLKVLARGTRIVIASPWRSDARSRSRRPRLPPVTRSRISAGVP